MFITNDLLCISVRQVFRQRRRYFWVLLSIALSTAGFIIIFALGQDVKFNLNNDLSFIGLATIINISISDDQGDEKDLIKEDNRFKEESLEALRLMPGVLSVTMLVKGSGFTNWGAGVVDYPLFGVDEYFWDIMGLRAMTGTFFSTIEMRDRAKVCVLGEKLARILFGTVDVVDRLLPIYEDIYRIVGVLQTGTITEQSDYCFVPYYTFQSRIQYLPPKQIYVRCNTWDDVESVTSRVLGVIGRQQSTADVFAQPPMDQLIYVRRIYWLVELFVYLSVIATMGLGGFGIWNGMMSAVDARTREIGLKKAMGAEDQDIMIQFLTESICLSLAAALLGILLGYAGIEVTAHFLRTQPSRALFFVYSGLSLGFSLFLGAGAGFYPSVRASRMEVVNALRYE
ncbi:putative ABC transport system permease protein [Desulfovibrionales bacterium]